MRFRPGFATGRELGAPMRCGNVAQGPLSGPAAFPSVTAIVTLVFVSMPRGTAAVEAVK